MIVALSGVATQCKYKMNIMMVVVSCKMHQLNVSLLNILGITSSFFAKRFVTWKSNNTWRSYRTEKVGCPTAMSFYLSAQKVFSCCSINLHPVSSIEICASLQSWRSLVQIPTGATLWVLIEVTEEKVLPFVKTAYG